MRLKIPQEPKELKIWMKNLQTEHLADPTINWDTYTVWAFNKLPKYLWDAWKDDLKPTGFTWQKFMRLLKYRTDIGVMWYKDFLSWDDFINKIQELIDGPIGRSLIE